MTGDGHRSDVDWRARVSRVHWRRRAVSLAILSTVVACLAIGLLLDARASVSAAPADLGKFRHATGQHARLACLMCHQRTDNASRLKLPGHTPCAGCHAQEFANPASPICTICHTAPPAAPVKPFPPRRSFTSKFDHARHNRGAAKPRAGCAACHVPERRGVALSIPMGMSAHSTCFQCHSPRARAGGRDISSCSTCHTLGRVNRASENSPSYAMNFDHGEHAAKGLECAACHVLVPGAPQSRQVTSPRPLQHRPAGGATTCATCHNGNKVFGSDNFSDCKRCHTGDTWHF